MYISTLHLSISKPKFVLLTFIFLLEALPFMGLSQEIEHSFKIVGKTRMAIVAGLSQESEVSYDSASPDHIIFETFNPDGSLLLRERHLCLVKKFDLSQMVNYRFNRNVVLDGDQVCFRKDGTIEKKSLYRAGILMQETTYYSNGKEQLLVSRNGNAIDGEYKIWYENGQLYYQGNYKENMKDGEFRIYDKEGNLNGQGVYNSGKLISGEAMVPDVLFENPDEKANYMGGDDAFNEYLKSRSAKLENLNKINASKRVDLRLSIDKSGNITQIDPISELSPLDIELLNQVFAAPPVFNPGRVEKVQVFSIYNLHLVLSPQGFKLNVEDQVFTKPAKMPEFPGGPEALRKYVEVNLRYPTEAQIGKIQGKVFVYFIVAEDGTVTNPKIARGVHELLDDEALRLVKTLPAFKPGQNESGTPIKVSFTLPITFKLQ